MAWTSERTPFDELRIKAARDYLKDINCLRRQFELNNMELVELRARLEGVDGIRYDKPFVKSSPTGDAIPRGIAILEELEAGNEHIEEQLRIAKALLMAVDGEAGTVLRFKYLMDMPATEIAQYMDRSKSTVFEREKDGLLTIYEMGLPIPYRLPDVKAV